MIVVSSDDRIDIDAVKPTRVGIRSFADDQVVVEGMMRGDDGAAAGAQDALKLCDGGIERREVREDVLTEDDVETLVVDNLNPILLLSTNYG